MKKQEFTRVEVKRSVNDQKVMEFELPKSENITVEAIKRLAKFLKVPYAVASMNHYVSTK